MKSYRTNSLITLRGNHLDNMQKKESIVNSNHSFSNTNLSQVVDYKEQDRINKRFEVNT